MRNPAGALSLDLTTLARLYQTQTTSPEEVAADVLARIRAFSDPAVWIHLLPEKTVRKQAQAVADRLARGEELPLYGVPYAVKDNIDVVGCPTTAACPAFAYVAERSAPVIARLEEAG